MLREIIDKLKLGLLIVILVGGCIWYFTTPNRLYAIYLPKEKLYEMDTVSKDDFRVFSVTRLGKVTPVEDFRLNSDEVSKTGLVAITSKEPKLGALVDLNSISVSSSELEYNDQCREDEIKKYKPKVSELIHFSDGSVRTENEKELDVEYIINKEEATINLTVDGTYDEYDYTFPMITADSITTKSKISTKKKLTSDALELILHYSDGSKKKLNNKKVRCDVIKKPKKGDNMLNCYYNGKKYVVKVKGFEPEDPRPKVTFPGYGTFILEYSKPYNVPGAARLNTWVGVRHFNNHRETYYSNHEPGGYGTNLYVPGKHLAEDGTIRDRDGYICVAANYRFCRPYQVVLTTLGPGKVYDTGCAYGTIDLYVNW